MDLKFPYDTGPMDAAQTALDRLACRPAYEQGRLAGIHGVCERDRAVSPSNRWSLERLARDLNDMADHVDRLSTPEGWAVIAEHLRTREGGCWRDVYVSSFSHGGEFSGNVRLELTSDGGIALGEPRGKAPAVSALPLGETSVTADEFGLVPAGGELAPGPRFFPALLNAVADLLEKIEKEAELLAERDEDEDAFVED